MIFDVIWTPRADKEFNNNVDYLLLNWSTQVVSDFYDRLDEVVEIIQSNPTMFPFHNSSKVYRICIVTEQITLYYSVINSTIYIVAIWNVYQNPKKLKLK
jgi:plasmid stabilization system protein ParE